MVGSWGLKPPTSNMSNLTSIRAARHLRSLLSRQARFIVYVYFWRFTYASTARRNSSAIGAPVLRDNLLSRATSASGSQTVVRFFTLGISRICQRMSRIECTHSENSLRIVRHCADATRERATDFQLIYAAFCMYFRQCAFALAVRKYRETCTECGGRR
jgi:hypothetical protein